MCELYVCYELVSGCNTIYNRLENYVVLTLRVCHTYFYILLNTVLGSIKVLNK